MEDHSFTPQAANSLIVISLEKENFEESILLCAKDIIIEYTFWGSLNNFFFYLIIFYLFTIFVGEWLRFLYIATRFSWRAAFSMDSMEPSQYGTDTGQFIISLLNHYEFLNDYLDI